MPTIVELPDKGVELEFPDGMSDEEMRSAILKEYPEPKLKGMSAGEMMLSQSEFEQKMAEGEVPTGEIDEPILKVPRMPRPTVVEPTATQEALRGIQNRAADIVEGISTPRNLVIGAGAIAAPGIIGPVLSATMVPSVVQGVKEAYQGIKSGDAAQIAGGLTESAAAGLGVLGGIGALRAGPLGDVEAAARIGRPDLTAADIAARQNLRIRDTPGLVTLPQSMKTVLALPGGEVGTLKERLSDATRIREDERQVPERGVEPQVGAGKSREDLERQAQEQPGGTPPQAKAQAPVAPQVEPSQTTDIGWTRQGELRKNFQGDFEWIEGGEVLDTAKDPTELIRAFHEDNAGYSTRVRQTSPDKFELELSEPTEGAESVHELIPYDPRAKLREALPPVPPEEPTPPPKVEPAAAPTPALTEGGAPEAGKTADPAQAAEKVKAEVKSVSKTEGARSAKEIKSELVDRLEKAHESAPTINDFTLEQQAKLTKAQSPDFGEVGNFRYGKRGDEQRAKAIEAVKAKRIAEATAAGFKQITIEIPGDGTFTIWNTKESIGDVLESARRLKTGKEPPSKAVPGRLDAAEYLKRDVKDALRVYGDDANAYQKLTSQLDRADELGIEEAQKNRLQKLTKELEKRILAPWENARSLLQSYERNVDANQGKAPRTLEQLKKVKELQDSVDAALYRVEQQLGRKPWEPRKPTTPTSAEPSVGPGAASRSDIAGGQTVVSNMFAAIDRDRAAMGKPPMEPGEPRTWDEDRQIATARMNRDPQWIPDLIKEVTDKPRPLTSWENMGMVLQKAYWKAEANNALGRIAKAAEDGREQDLVEAKADATRFEDRLAEMETAVGRGGTGSEAGRTLQAQKMGLTDDLSLVEMRLEMRGKVGGRPLTDAESSEIARIHGEYERNLKAIGEKAAASERAALEANTRATLAELARQTAEAKVPPPHIQTIVNRIGDVIHSQANAARERLRGKLFTIGDPEVLLDLARVGADNIWTLGEDFARWSVKMVEDIGEHVRPHLQQIWDASKQFINDTTDAAAGAKRAVRGTKAAQTAQTVKDTISRGDTPEAKIGKLMTRIERRVRNNEVNKIAPAVQQLARQLMEQGIRGRDELVQRLHQILEPMIPDWTEYDTRQALSGYGDYKRLSKDEISTELRTYKGQLQQILKLEDMANKQAPLRTGLERREVTPAERQLIKLVNEAKRRGGYTTTNPETQLRTALDEVKKRTQTSIEDYERRLREEDFTVRKLEPIKPDPELQRLQANQKRIRKTWEEAKRQKELAARKPWQKVLDKFVRWERAFKLSSPVVFGKLTSAALTRVVTTTTEETAGLGLKRVPGIATVARQAPREGTGLNVRQLSHAMAKAVTDGMRDASQTATKGAADIDVLYGEKLIDKDWANVFGQFHGMFKAPVKRMEFEYSLAKRIEDHVNRTGQAPDELEMAGLSAQALNDGYRTIFMQRGFFSDWFNTGVMIAEKSKTHPIAGEVSARVLRFLLPIVRVPMNIVAETATGVYGAPVGLARVMFHAIKGTLDTLDPVVADSIMRQFKKGSIGLGLMAIGYLNPQAVGGYDWREKRQPRAAKTSGFQLKSMAGIWPADKDGNIPRWVTHAPWFELMQIGGTIRHVKDQHVKGTPKGVGEGLWAAGLGLVEETPFVNEMLQAGKLFDSNQRSQWLGAMARGTLVPQAVQQIAALTDTAEKRKPTNVIQGIEMGIPGLRQNVPPPKVRGTHYYP